MTATGHWVNKQPCAVCDKAVIYLGAEYCSYMCQMKGIARKSGLVWHNAKRSLDQEVQDEKLRRAGDVQADGD